MAYGYASVPAADRASAAADKPMNLGANYLRDISTAPEWRQGGSWAAGTDETDSDGPTRYAYDNIDRYRTYPDSSQTTWYLLFDFGATGISLDAVALLDVANLTGVQIDVQIADDNAFTTNLVTLATTTRSGEGRVVLLDMDGHAVGVEQRYTTVRYMRLKFTKGSGFIPKLGEVIISRRYQLEFKPNTPKWDPNNLMSHTEQFESDSGCSSDYVYYKKRRVINVDINPDETTYIDNHVTWWEDDIDGGTLPFLWIDDPATYPELANWMKLPKNPQLSGVLKNPSMRMFSFRALEVAPNFLKLEET